MASSPSCSISLSTASPPPPAGKRPGPRRSSLKIRARSYRSEEGRGGHIGDANLRVLRERIEEVRVKERLERCLESEFGWNNYNIAINDCCKHARKEKMAAMPALLQLVCNVGGAIGFTIVGCSFCLYLTSIFIHFTP
nr:transmembrane protein, putative [Ipomoea batatas]